LAKWWVCALASAAMLAGCGGDRLAAPVRTGANGVTRPATIAELYDGSYQGRAVLVSATGPNCPVWPRNSVVEIGDATLVYPYLPNLVLAAPVARDGSLYAQAGPAVLDGRIFNNRLEFAVRTPSCQSRYSMHFVWNHS
jgi:hypothetical protein